jgi:hypothetical protein
MRRSILSRLREDESGFGLVLVLGMAGILTSLMLVATTMALRSLESSRQHVSFESALAVAEGGTDSALARAQTRYQAVGADTYLTPAAGDATCNQAAVVWPTGPTAWPIGGAQPTPEEERTWARTQLETIATNPACRQTIAGGEFVTLKPQGRQTVYTMGWSPSYGASEVKKRVIKSEYLFTPYKPSHAILTGGTLSLDSSTLVTSAPPNDPALAAVHSNGNVIVSSGNPIVYGLVSQSGTGGLANSNKFYGNTSGNVVGQPKQTIPYLGARSIWGSNRLSNPPGGWYDLCPDGTVRLPDAAEPCASGATILATLTATGSFRGWSPVFTGPVVTTWRAGTAIKTSGFSGTYYVHHANVLNDASNAGSPVPNLTVLASSPSLTCNKTAGNIDWGSTDPAAPSIANTWLVADQDLRTSSNYQAGSASGPTIISGFFLAGDQIEMSTSSNGAYGAVIAADQCDPPNGTSMVDSNSIKNPSIYYDPNSAAPFIDIINTTLWLEYPG